MLVLAGIAIIALGFLLRFNPMLVIAASALVTGLAAGIDPLAILAAFGKAFNDTRYVTAIYIVLPVIGLLERCIEQGRAEGSITSSLCDATLAQSLYQLWLGASLMMKLSKRSQAFEESLTMAKRLLS